MPLPQDSNEPAPVGLSEVIGFVTEFNQNVQIFDEAAMLLLALFEQSILAEARFDELEAHIEKTGSDAVAAARRADQQVMSAAVSRAMQADREVLAKAVAQATENAIKALQAAANGGALANANRPNPLGALIGVGPVISRSLNQDFPTSLENELKNRSLRRP